MRHPSANACQRSRRTRNRRIDYYPSREAERVIEAVRAPLRPNSGSSTNGAILDAIVTAWADHAGIKYSAITMPPSSGRLPELSDANARANDFGDKRLPENRTKQAARVTCGARRRRDGEPCQAKSVPGKRRCKWHGGCSTGPKTPEGKARALANLRRGAVSRLNVNSSSIRRE